MENVGHAELYLQTKCILKLISYRQYKLFIIIYVIKFIINLTLEKNNENKESLFQKRSFAY